MIIYKLLDWNKLPSFLDQSIDRVNIETVTNDIGRDTYSHPYFSKALILIAI